MELRPGAGAAAGLAALCDEGVWPAERASVTMYASKPTATITIDQALIAFPPSVPETLAARRQSPSPFGRVVPFADPFLDAEAGEEQDDDFNQSDRRIHGVAH